MPPSRRSSFSPSAMFRGISNAVTSFVSGGDDVSDSEESQEAEESAGVETRGARAAREAIESAKASAVDTSMSEKTPRAKRAAAATPSESLIARAARVKAADLARVTQKSRDVAEAIRRREERAREAAEKAATEQNLATLAAAAAAAEPPSSSHFPAAGGPEAGNSESVQYFPHVDSSASEHSFAGSAATNVSAHTEADQFLDDMSAAGLTGVARVLRDEVGIASLAEMASYSLDEIVDWLKEAGRTIRPGTPMAKKLAAVTSSPEKQSEPPPEEAAPTTDEPDEDKDDLELPKHKKKQSQSAKKIGKSPVKKRGKARATESGSVKAERDMSFLPGGLDAESSSVGEKLRAAFGAALEQELEDPTSWLAAVEDCPLLRGVVESFHEHEHTAEQASDFCFSLLAMFKIEACEMNVEIVSLQLEAELERILEVGEAIVPEGKRGAKALRAHLVLAHARMRSGKQHEKSSNEFSSQSQSSQSSQAQAAAMGAAVAASRMLSAAGESSEGKQSSAKSLAAERARERVRAVAQDAQAREALFGLSDLGKKAEPKEFLRKWNEVNRVHVKTAELLHTERLSGPVLGTSAATSAFSMFSEGGEGVGWEGYAEEVASAAQLAQSQFFTACSKARLADTSAASVGERLSKSALFGSVIGADSASKTFKLSEMTEEQDGFTLVARGTGSKSEKRADAKALIDSSLVALTLAHEAAHPTDSSITLTFGQIQRKAQGPTSTESHHDVIFGAFFKAYAARWADFQNSPVSMPVMEDVWEDVKKEDRVRDASQLQMQQQMKEKLAELEKEIKQVKESSSSRRGGKGGDPSPAPPGTAPKQPAAGTQAGEKPYKVRGPDRAKLRKEAHELRVAASEAIKAAKTAKDADAADAESLQETADAAKKKAEATQAKLQEKEA
jgi:hypothetical protein